MKGLFNLINFSFQHLKSRLMKFWLWNDFFFFNWGTLHAKIYYWLFISNYLDHYLIVNNNYWLLLWQHWFSPSLTPPWRRHFRSNSKSHPYKICLYFMKFYFFNCYEEGKNDPSKHLEKFYFSIKSNQGINIHFTKETHLVGFELVFVYQRKYSIHHRHFSWSTLKKLWYLGFLGHS